MTKKKRQFEDICKHMPTELREVCKECKRYIPEDQLGHALSKLPRLIKKVAVLKRLEQAFTGLVEAFRKLDVHFSLEEDGVNKCMAVPLLPALQILGIAAPARVEGTDYLHTLCEFCSKLGIDEMPWNGNVFFVQSKHITTLIRAANYPPGIVRRFDEWFEAFVNERKAGTGGRHITLFT